MDTSEHLSRPDPHLGSLTNQQCWDGRQGNTSLHWGLEGRCAHFKEHLCYNHVFSTREVNIPLLPALRVCFVLFLTIKDQKNSFLEVLNTARKNRSINSQHFQSVGPLCPYSSHFTFVRFSGLFSESILKTHEHI